MSTVDHPVLGNREDLRNPSFAEERRDFQRFLKNMSPKLSESLISTLVGRR